MKPRVGETAEAFRARRNAYYREWNAANKARRAQIVRRSRDKPVLAQLEALAARHGVTVESLLTPKAVTPAAAVTPGQVEGGDE